VSGEEVTVVIWGGEGIACTNTSVSLLLFSAGAATPFGFSPPPWFRNSKFFQGGVVAPRPISNLEDQGLHLVWPLPFDLSGIGGSTRSLRSRQPSCPGEWDAQTSPR
jgi:predicted acylesterase/phospholipase RssA